jgi:hypothetical protein
MFFLDSQMDVLQTPLTSAPAIYWRQVDQTPSGGSRLSSGREITRLSSTVAPSADTEVTAMLSESGIDPMGTTASERGLRRSVLDQEARVPRERARLISAKHEYGEKSRELLRRLELLDRRMLELFPRFTPAQVDHLENLGDRIAIVNERRLERARRYALKS